MISAVFILESLGATGTGVGCSCSGELGGGVTGGTKVGAAICVRDGLSAEEGAGEGNVC